MTGLFWAMSLVLADATFLEKWRHALVPESLPKGPTRFLLAAALEHWDLYHKLMDWPSYLSWVDGAVEDEDLHEDHRQIYMDITAAYPVTDSSRFRAWEQAEEWVQNYHVGMALDRARAALVAGDRSGAFSELLGLREVTGEEREEPLTLEPTASLGDIIRQRRADWRKPIPLGIDQFDEALEGGVQPGDLAIVAGPTNLGKSMFLCYLAASAYKANRRVLYMTYELSRLQIGERILMALLEKPKQELNPDTLADELIARRERWGVTKGSVLIEEGMHTVADLRQRLGDADVDLVLLDSADDISPRQNYPNLYLAQGEVYSDILRDICHTMHFPVWTSVQLNREAVERAKVSLKHIGDSFKKVQRSTLCVALSQSVEEEGFYLGPVIKLWVLKDTEHGAKGLWHRYVTKFGRGFKGWPGFDYYPERGALE